MTTETTILEKVFTGHKQLQRAKYYPQDNVIEIEFPKGAVYHYYEGSQEIFNDLITNESPGSVFYGKIRDQLPYKLISKPEVIKSKPIQPNPEAF